LIRANECVSNQGFTLLETLTALVVLMVGVIAVATLAARCTTSASQSKYMSLAAQLASEKLEDLSRYDANDPNVCVQSGDGSEGSITADAPLKNITCPSTSSSSGASGTVAYYDQVSVNTATGTVDCPNPTYGCFTEVVYYNSNGTTSPNGYTVTSHSPDGTVTVTRPTTPPTALAVTFDRRWVIEQDPVVNGVTITGSRRVTVLVTLIGTPLPQGGSLYAPLTVPVTFQMSMVRP
jgi:Tfp pilus assembly protein PilV